MSFQIRFDKSARPHGQPLQSTIITSDTSDSFLTRVSIDSLALGQDYFVNVESNGCFHRSNLQLIISKELTGYFASFKMKGLVEGKKVNSKMKKIRLNAFQVDTVRNFEKQLGVISSSKYDCTTVDSYTLSIAKKSAVYIVDDCNWQGFSKLIGNLFKKHNDGVQQ